MPKLNQSLRTDCPFCGGKNTFTISNKNGKILWHCYRASCGSKGAVDKELTKDELANWANNNSIVYSGTDFSNNFSIEKFNFINILSSEKVVKYLTRFNCLQPYLENRADIRYDPKRNRIVFLVYSKDRTILGATGRSMDGTISPKWYRYDKTPNLLFTCQGKINDTKTCVLVEDAISACAISNIGVDGIALLGTNIVDAAISSLAEYDKLIIALDYDATNKAIKFQRDLKNFVNTEILMLERDIKYLTLDEMKELYNGI